MVNMAMPSSFFHMPNHAPVSIFLMMRMLHRKK